MEPLGNSIKKIMGDRYKEIGPPACDACKDNGWIGVERSDLDRMTGEGLALSAERYCIRCDRGRAKAAEHEANQVLFAQAKINDRMRRLTRQLGPGQVHYTLKSYVDAGGLPALARLVVEWLDAEPASFADDEEPWQPWLYVGGSVGAGKTGLVIPVALQYVRSGAGSASFVVVSDWLQSIRDQYGKQGVPEEETPPAYVHQDVDLLILDDLGVGKQNDWTTEQLFTLLNYRFNHRKRTILTSNYTLPEFRDRLSGDDAGRRIPSRIAEMCWGDRWVFNLEGRDIRTAKRAVS